MNHTPNANTQVSAYEALTGYAPDVSRMVPFYAPGVYHLTSDERKDPWSPKARPCRMLGYADNYLHAYHILNVETGKVIVRENCVFDISAIADDPDGYEEDRSPNRDDIDEFDKMVQDSDYEESDSDVSSNPDIDEDSQSDLEEDDEDPTGGENPYWNAMSYTITEGRLDAWKREVFYSTLDILALPPNPTSITEALEGPHGDKWQAAITKELDGFRLRGTFGPAEQDGYGMKSKLILQYKYDSEYNLLCKARMVLCGYSQREGIDYFDTYSPTTSNPIIIMLLCIAGHIDCHVGTFDVSAAYLEGKSDTTMFAWLPKEISKDNVRQRVEILGNWYGSKQAGKIWNELFDLIITEIGFERCPDMPCLYKWVQGNEFMYVTVHVDDGMALSSNSTILTQLVEVLQQRLHKVVKNDGMQLFLGMDMARSNDGRYFQISQERYVVNKYGEYTRTYHTPMATTTNLRIEESNENNDSLLADSGTMRYVADRTRPDILVALGEMSTGGAEHPSNEHLKVAERIKHYLISTKVNAITVGGPSPIVMFGYCDAAYVTTGNCKSRLGSCLFLNHDSGSISNISRNDTTVSHSSTEAEIKAIDMICREIVYMRKVLAFVGQTQTNATRVYVDNKSAIELCRLLKATNKVKHINVKIHYIRELINERVIELVFVPTDYNVADVLTKALDRTKHERHTDVLLHGHRKHLHQDRLPFESYEFYMNIAENEIAAEEYLCISEFSM